MIVNRILFCRGKLVLYDVIEEDIGKNLFSLEYFFERSEIDICCWLSSKWYISAEKNRTMVSRILFYRGKSILYYADNENFGKELLSLEYF